MINRLSSRKFLLSVVGFALLFYVGEYEEAVYVLLGYVGMEGVRDIVGQGTVTTAINKTIRKNGDDEDYEVDKSSVVTGKVLSPTSEKIEQ